MKKLYERFVAWLQYRKELRQRNIEREKFKDSSEPWVSIIGSIEDPQRGLKLDLDWNDAFIQYLRKSGIPGIKDEDVVAYWITVLHKQQIEEGSFE